MGILDDLKQQADALTQAREHGAQRALDIAQRADAVLATAYRYFDDLGKQLAVIKPTTTRVFNLYGIGSFDQLRMTDFFADYRKKVVEDKEVYDYVLFQFKYLSPKTFQFRKDDALAKEQIEKQLWAAGLKYSMDEYRNERNRIIGAAFKIPGIIIASLHLTGKPDSEDLLLTVRNVERFDTLKLQFPHSVVNDALFEEMAKLVLGRPNQLLRIGQVLL